MNDLSDLSIRARICAGCHVGSPPITDEDGKGMPARDVNHDLIAAGHPRLAFELSSYQANMPPHWRPSGERRGVGPPVAKEVAEDRIWSIGQLESARAALELLAHRAAHRDRPWPEFAEYDCFACHHNLNEPSWRQAFRPVGRRPGSLPWGSWYLGLTGPLLAADSTALDALERAMQKPHPDRTAVSVLAREAADELAKFKLPDDILSRPWIEQMLREEPMPIARSWDTAEQLYLALHVFNTSGKGRAVPLERLSHMRAFLPGYSSPTVAGSQPFLPGIFFETLRKALRD
jgi:hypothetical protein